MIAQLLTASVLMTLVWGKGSEEGVGWFDFFHSERPYGTTDRWDRFSFGSFCTLSPPSIWERGITRHDLLVRKESLIKKL
jgi:hypothetical protein